MMAAKELAPADGSRYPTRVKESATPDTDGRYGAVEVPDHDDYDCLDDLIAAGLLQPVMPTAHAGKGGGWFLDARRRVVTTRGGDVVRPEFVTGLDEWWLATRAAWTLTDVGRQVAAGLRAHQAAGGNFHTFTPASAVEGAV